VAKGQVETDEWHESGSVDGLTAIVLEAEELRPEILMPASL
jgi:hypothetical protein